MRHPYQCLAAVKPSSSSEHMLAANGSKLLYVDVSEGKVVSEWTASAATPNVPNGGTEDGRERPNKKQKTASTQEASASIIKLKISPDQQHAVVVTDDKYLRVFSLQDGTLAELSQRSMPKRPCAIDILPDNTTVLCGDKFGDVYSMPLLPEPMEPEDATAGATEASLTPEKPAWKPSASTSTVHSKRNRETLEAQMKQKNFTAKKEALKFEHKLLLGHVSMLTDMCFATHSVEGKQRGYIITADRDEHIRVSRGSPQSHIIEGYCLAHHDYISKICLIPETDLLVSGGGDDSLGIWEWPAFKLRRKIEIRDYVLEVLAPSNAERTDVAHRQGDETAMKPADDPVKAMKEANKDINISGLWNVPFSSAKGKQDAALVVASEKLPALFIIPQSRLTLKSDIVFGVTILRLDHAPLDVTCVGGSMLVSLDARDDGKQRLQAFKLSQKEGEKDAWRTETRRDHALEEKLSGLVSIGIDEIIDNKKLDELLYGVANMRKRRGWDDVDGAAEDIDAMAVGGEAVVSNLVPDEGAEA